MSNPLFALSPLGSTGIVVPPIGFGASALAGMPGLYGHGVSEDDAIATVQAVLASGVPFLDTSNGYGEHGESELRIGAAIRAAGGLPDGFLLVTKVDPSHGSDDFSGDRVRASLEESLERLGIDRVPLLHLHDPERISFEAGVAPGGPLEALVDLRDRGLVDAIGVAGGPVGLLQQYLDTGEFDVVLSHNRFTLLDRSADQLFAAAHARGIGVLNAAPFGGGMLAKGPAVQDKYAYGMGGPAAYAAAVEMQAVCDRYGVPLAAAALQFSIRSADIDSTILGVSTPARVASTITLATLPIPDDLWAELETLVPPRDTWLVAGSAG